MPLVRDSGIDALLEEEICSVPSAVAVCVLAEATFWHT